MLWQTSPFSHVILAVEHAQRLFRGSADRRRAREEREEEMIYIGMKPAESTVEGLQRDLDIAYRKRKQEQVKRAAPREGATPACKCRLLAAAHRCCGNRRLNSRGRGACRIGIPV